MSRIVEREIFHQLGGIDDNLNGDKMMNPVNHGANTCNLCNAWCFHPALDKRSVFKLEMLNLHGFECQATQTNDC